MFFRLSCHAHKIISLTRHSFRIHAGVEPATSRSETGRSPLELMDSAELLPVSLKHFTRRAVCLISQKRFHASGSELT